MGVRASCICDPSSSRREVIVMKENGEFLRFKEYIRVKDILASNPSHKVIRCRSIDRNNNNNDFLPDSFQLSCNHLYFLLPPQFFLTNETYQNMLRLALAAAAAASSTYTGNIPTEEVLLCSKDDDQNDQNNNNSSRWKPALKTIPELNSPAPISGADCRYAW